MNPLAAPRNRLLVILGALESEWAVGYARLITTAEVGMRQALAIAGALMMALPGTAGASPIVRVDGGTIRGEQLVDRVAFRGVPFAAPPIGALRWRAPAPVRGWRGVRDATRSAPSCAQLSEGWNAANAAGSREDCLYLEVATPALDGGKRPVFVWVHGGSNRSGGAQGTIMSSLVRRGIVLVSVQYRLGALGFMAHSALSREAGASGNYGLMDQQAALRWVRRNIAKFGGDPARVTLGGESAGAMDVGLQQVAPGARGLFAQAVEGSGTAGFGYPARDLEASEAIGEQIAAAAGAPHASAARLRALPLAALLAAGDKLHVAATPGPGMAWLQVTIDGKVITEAPAATLARGGGARVPLLIGANAREIGFYDDPAAARHAVDLAFGARAAAARRFYGLDAGAMPAPDPLRGPVPMQAATDTVFTCPSEFVATALTRAGVPVWRYEFAYDPPGGPTLAHASELRTIFSRAGEDGVPADAPRLQDAWANFIMHGDPNPVGSAAWPTYGAARNYVSYGAGEPVVARALRGSLCVGWDRP